MSKEKIKVPPKLFHKTVLVDRPEKEKAPSFMKKHLKRIIAVIILLAIFTYMFLQVGFFINTVATNWTEIEFAMEKPAIVKIVRQDYQTKQSKMEQSFLKPEKSSEEQLVNAVVEKLQSKNLE